MKFNPATNEDFYKVSHPPQYPKGTTKVYANFTPRSGKLSNLPCFDGKVVFFGLQYFLKDYLIKTWQEEFFSKPKEEVIKKFMRRMETSLGLGAVHSSWMEELHDLGYLPIEIRAVAEGTAGRIGVPFLTITNTLPNFYWLTNFLETVLSSYLWFPCTSATTAKWYRDLFDKYALETTGDTSFCQWQGHDFSFRGQTSPQSAAMSGAGHLLSFTGTDTIPAIDFMEDYYNANAEKELIGGSVPATEHSVMCMGGKEEEIATFQRLITEVYPSGIVSIVSDTWDFWKVVTEYVSVLKPEILARNGKVVIRPDSGDPVKIICGDSAYDDGDHTHMNPKYKGAVECLWDIFGGTITPQGYKQLDSHIGLIYGDSITPQRAMDILEGLKAKGFASTNVVFGIGSFTYQYVTRDTYGFAVKSTYGEVNGVGREIFKDPITDNGTKKSARGLLQVREGLLYDQQPTVEGGDLKVVFKDGKLLKDWTLQEVRENLKNSSLSSLTTKAA